MSVKPLRYPHTNCGCVHRAEVLQGVSGAVAGRLSSTDVDAGAVVSFELRPHPSSFDNNDQFRLLTLPSGTYLALAERGVVPVGDDVSMLASVVAVDAQGRASPAAALLVQSSPCETVPAAEPLGRCDPHAQCWQHVPAAAPVTPSDIQCKCESGWRTLAGEAGQAACSQCDRWILCPVSSRFDQVTCSNEDGSCSCPPFLRGAGCDECIDDVRCNGHGSCSRDGRATCT